MGPAGRWGEGIQDVLGDLVFAGDAYGKAAAKGVGESPKWSGLRRDYEGWKESFEEWMSKAPSNRRHMAVDNTMGCMPQSMRDRIQRDHYRECGAVPISKAKLWALLERENGGIQGITIVKD